MDSESDTEDLRDACKLHNAAEAGDKGAVLAIIDETKQRLEFLASNPNHGIASLEAMVRIHTDQVINASEMDGLTPFHLALVNGHFECAKVLLDNGADAHQSCEGSYPQHIIAQLAALSTFHDSCTAAMQMFADIGLSQYQEDDNSRTALHWAAASNHGLLCDAILNAGEEERDARRKENAARLAAQPATDASLPPPIPSTPSLPELGPLMALPDDRGNTALHVAARGGCAQALQMLLSFASSMTWDSPTSQLTESHTQPHQAFLLHCNKVGQTALHSAVLGGCPKCVAALADACPLAVSMPDRVGVTPLQAAERRRGSPAVLQALRAVSQGGAAASALPQEIPDGRQGYEDGVPSMVIVTSPDCLAHHTAKPPLLRGASIPPENIRRLEVLLDRRTGILRSSCFQHCVWAEDCHPVAMTDVLRVHTWKHVRNVRETCAATPEDSGTSHIDSDTTVSRGSFRAALKAAGAVCHGIDDVVNGRAKRAFCAVRPPGHHAGPHGMVTGRTGLSGSHGFCLLNNVAIGAAYAVSTYRHSGIRRVALLDFDVHHGNGTEECVFSTVPHETRRSITTPFSDGHERFHHWRPWFDGDDRRNILFASVQGYGPRSGRGTDFVYPGTGATSDNARHAHSLDESELAEHSEADMCVHPPRPLGPSTAPEDPDNEFSNPLHVLPTRDGPRVINVGVPGPGVKANLWRRSWRDKILPAVVNFAPDLILVSAGFDAHRKDDMNFNFVGVREHDYAWLSDQIVQVANRVCQGRVVSVLEGGYRVQGQVVSAFARSVAAHVLALAEPNGELWQEEATVAEREAELRERERKLEMREKRARGRMGEAPPLQHVDKDALPAGIDAAAVLPAMEMGSAAAAAAAAGMAAAGTTTDNPDARLAIEAPVGSAASQEAPAAENGAVAVEEAGGEYGGRVKRRRGSAPDYVSLNKELEERKEGL